MNIDISLVKGVGKQTKQKLNMLNIYNTQDLINTCPKRYLNYEVLDRLDLTNHNTNVTIQGVIASSVNVSRYTKTKVVRFNLLFNNKLIGIIAFNQPYLARSLKENETVFVSGKYDYYKNEIVLSKLSTKKSIDEIKPVYNLLDIYDSNITKIMKNLFVNKQYNIKETLDKTLIDKYNYTFFER